MKINRSREPVRRAFTTHNRVFGREQDPDMKRYMDMDLDRFNKVVEKYGLDNALRYMKTMEYKRMMRDYNA